jgi:hypothetical protein
MEPSLTAGPLNSDPRVIDHAANEPESAKSKHTSFERELARITRSRTYFDDTDPVNAAIRRSPTQAMFIAAGIGFAAAILMR